MDQQFESINKTQRAQQLLAKFEDLELPHMPLSEKYKFVVQLYLRDLEFVHKLYKSQCNDPPISRDMPPMAGKIAWARQLFRRINAPMQIYQSHPRFLYSAEGKKAIKLHNVLCKVLVEYEILHHRGWLRQVKNSYLNIF